MKIEKGLEWEQERKSKFDLIKTMLSTDHVLNLTENEFSKKYQSSSPSIKSADFNPSGKL